MGASAAGSDDSGGKSEEGTAAADIVGGSDEEGGGAWQKIIRGLGREGGSPSISAPGKCSKEMKVYDSNAENEGCK